MYIIVILACKFFQIIFGHQLVLKAALFDLNHDLNHCKKIMYSDFYFFY